MFRHASWYLAGALACRVGAGTHAVVGVAGLAGRAGQGAMAGGALWEVAEAHFALGALLPGELLPAEAAARVDVALQGHGADHVAFARLRVKMVMQKNATYHS